MRGARRKGAHRQARLARPRIWLCVAIATILLAVCAVVGVLAHTLRGSVGPPSGDAKPPAGKCTNSDGSPCPASYFDGPLGQDNLVPSGTGALLIEYYDGVGTSWDQARVAIQQRQQHIGRRFDGIQISYGDDGHWAGLYGMYSPEDITPRREQWIIDNGSFVAVAWTPDYTIGEMNQGAADAIWAKAAAYWKSYAPHRIMLRPFAEFNLPSRSSAVPSPENGDVDYCGAPFIRAWQRMVDVFQANGADNVGFWFTPDEGNARACVDDSYPGDGYVDWVGSDFYNRCLASESTCYSTPLHPGPATFAELFGYRGTCASGVSCKANLHDVLGPRKPFVVGETGTVYDSAQPNSKGGFYRSVAADARHLRYLRGVSFFDADVSDLEGPKTNWRVDLPEANPDPYDGFTSMANDSWFAVN